MQGHATERERHSPVAAVEGGGVQGGVEQRGMQAVRGGVGVVGDGDLGVHGAVRAPGGPQGLEDRAVVEAALGELCVEAGEIHRFGVCGWPLLGRVGSLGRRGGQHAVGVSDPLDGLAGGPGVHDDGACAAFVRRPHADLELDGGTVGGQHERGGQRDLGDVRAADLVADMRGEVDIGGPGQ